MLSFQKENGGPGNFPLSVYRLFTMQTEGCLLSVCLQRSKRKLSVCKRTKRTCPSMVPPLWLALQCQEGTIWEKLPPIMQFFFSRLGAFWGGGVSKRKSTNTRGREKIFESINKSLGEVVCNRTEGRKYHVNFPSSMTSPVPYIFQGSVFTFSIGHVAIRPNSSYPLPRDYILIHYMDCKIVKTRQLSPPPP